MMYLRTFDINNSPNNSRQPGNRPDETTTSAAAAIVASSIAVSIAAPPRSNKLWLAPTIEMIAIRGDCISLQRNFGEKTHSEANKRFSNGARMRTANKLYNANCQCVTLLLSSSSLCHRVFVA